MRNIVRDLIVTISGDGWQFKAARLLVDSDGHAAVFTVRGDPDKTFDVADVSKISQMNGRFVTTEGETVAYHRRGASCAWKLAKCNVKTPALVALWDGAAPPAAPEPDDHGLGVDADAALVSHTTEEPQPDEAPPADNPDSTIPPSDPDSDLL